MDEDDDLSDNMEISIDEVLVDDDYSLSRLDQSSFVKSKLAEYLDPLCTALDGTDQNLIYKTFLNALCPVAFDVVLPETDKLDIPLDMSLIKALEYEVLSVLMNTNDPLEAIAEFKKLERPSGFCGKIFKPQQFTYSCRDCAVDATCVMCSECFNNSIHTKCNYKMHQSQGGGCCDCGDPEAWTNGYACLLHQPRTDDEERPETEAERRLSKRSQKLFLAIIRLAYELLVQNVEVFDADDMDDSPPSRATGFDNLFHSSHLIAEQLNDSADSRIPYVLALYNDEVHTYDEVERMLIESVQATKQDAKGYAIVVDQTGRTLLKQGTRDECRQVQKIVIRETQISTEYQRMRGYENAGPIKSLVIDRRLLGLQEVAIRLLKRVNLLNDELEIFRNSYVLACQKQHWAKTMEIVTYKGNPPCNPKPFLKWTWNETESDELMSTVELILLSDVYTWKNVRSTMIRTLVESFLKKYENKLYLARIFSKHYKAIYSNVDDDDHDVKYSVSSITVQLFTTPSVVYALLENENIFESIMEIALERIFPPNPVTSERRFKKERRHRYSHYQGCDLTDISYFTSHMPDDKLASARDKVIAGMGPFVELMRLFQGLDNVKHARESHVDLEPAWEHGITFIMSVSQVLKQLQTWCSADPIILRKMVKNIVEILRTRRTEEEIPAIITDLSSFNRHTRIVWNHFYNIISIDVSSKLVGIHHMLSRFLLELMCRDESIIDYYNKDELILLSAETIAAQCLTCQCKAGLWKRNGTSLMSMVFWYTRSHIRDVMALQDVKALQFICRLFDSPDDFLATLLNGCGLNPDSANDEMMLEQLVSQGTTDREKIEIKQQRMTHNWIENDSNTEYRTKLIGEFLSMLVGIINGRFEHTSTLTEKEDIRQRLLHYLAEKYFPWSKIVKYLSSSLSPEQLKMAESMLPQLADTVTINNTKCYKIKVSALANWDRFYVHYEHEEQSAALETVQQLVKNEPDRIKSSIWLPKENCKLLGNYTKVLDLLEAPLFARMITTFLQNKDQKQRIIDKCIYLIILAVQHDKAAWVKEHGLVEILNKLKEDGADVNGLDFIKEKLGVQDSQACADAEADAKADRRARARAMREKMMANMAKMSNNFIEQNKDQFTEKKESCSEDEEFHSAEEDFVDETQDRNLFNMKEKHYIEETWTCVMCQADQETTMKPDNKDPLVMVGFGECSAVLNRGTRDDSEEMCHNEIFSEFQHYAPLHWSEGYHISTCGHAFHLSCLEKIKSNQSRSTFARGHLYRWLKPDEFVCMLCNRLCNLAIPIIPKRIHHESRKMEHSPIKKQNRKLWEWIRESEYELAPEKREQKKTYVIKLGTLDVTKEDKNDDDTKTDQDEMKLDWNNDIKKVEQNTESMEVDTLDRAMLETKSDDETDSDDDDDFDTWRSSDFSDNAITTVFDFINHFGRRRGHYKCLMTDFIPLIKSFAYVVMSTERLLALTDKPVLGHLPVRRDKCLEYTLRCILAYVKGTFYNDKGAKSVKDDIRLIGNQLITSLFPGCIKDRDSTPILLSDPFVLYVMLCITNDLITSKPKEECSIKVEHNYLRLVLAAHIVQVALFTTDASIASVLNGLPERDAEIDDDEINNFAQLINQLRNGANLPSLQCSPQVIYSFTIHCITPLMRCVVIFRTYLNMYNIEYISSNLNFPTFSSLCKILSLQTPLTSFFDADGSSLEPQAQKWIHHMFEVKNKFQVSTSKLKFPRLTSIPRLIKLPSDYRTVVENSLNYRCHKNPSQELSAPAMCLVCGATVCALSKCCTQSYFSDNKNKIGGATAHAVKCCKGVGLFMLIRNDHRNNPLNQLARHPHYEPCSGIMMTIRHDKVCSTNFSLPYVDAHGESDRGLKRGAPLNLSKASFDKIEAMWLGHEIPETISRAQSQHTGRSLAGTLPQWELF